MARWPQLPDLNVNAALWVPERRHDRRQWPARRVLAGRAHRDRDAGRADRVRRTGRERRDRARHDRRARCRRCLGRVGRRARRWRDAQCRSSATSSSWMRRCPTPRPGCGTSAAARCTCAAMERACSHRRAMPRSVRPAIRSPISSEKRTCAALLDECDSAIAGVPITRRWACQRAYTEDRKMRLGRDPNRPWLVWAAGLGGHGATAAPAVGERVAAAVVEAL